MSKFTGNKKPSLKKNFFENYEDHLKFLKRENIYKYTDPNRTAQITDRLESLEGIFEALDLTLMSLKVSKKDFKSHLKMFDGLRDAHDYCDELMGATVLTAASIALAIAFACKALFEVVEPILQSKKKSSYNDAEFGPGAYAFVALATLIFAVGAFLKSVVSLITRPVVTLFQGYKPQDEARFYSDNDSLIACNWNELKAGMF